MDGHYFIGPACPLDGWSSAESLELTKAVEKLTDQHMEISLASLQQIGISDRALQQGMIVEYPGNFSGFDLLTPGPDAATAYTSRRKR